MSLLRFVFKLLCRLEPICCQEQQAVAIVSRNCPRHQAGVLGVLPQQPCSSQHFDASSPLPSFGTLRTGSSMAQAR